ncbi:MAG: hypothetical protein H6712_05945 [Myxococcales bacterium]|nr:hypothetical protein [Myxococcales bacterium]MCB9713378.1 hypothetical protein [Myxococcales bacterium]
MASIAGAAACSGDLGAGELGDTEGTGPGSIDEDGTGWDGADTTGTGEEPNDESAGDEGEPACPVDCGEGGLCELDEDDNPYCACSPGYAPYGLRCLECTTSQGQLDVDVSVVMLDATFRLGGEPFPASIYENGELTLRDPRSGDEVQLGQTRYGGTQEPVAILPGAYEVYFSRLTGGEVVPANHDARVGTVHVPDAGSHSLTIDVPAVELSGSFTFNGTPPPDNIYENGRIVLRDPRTGDEIDLGQTRHATFERVVVPGTYELRYRRIVAQSLAPLNPDALVGTVELLESSSLDVDIPVTTVSGAFLLDGAAPPASIYENGELRLRDPRTGTDLVLGQTRDGAYTVPVVAGQYEVVYRRLVGGDQVPVNTAAVVDVLDASGDAAEHDIDVQTAIVSGTITVGGGAPPTDPSNDGLLLLRNAETGDEARLGNTHDGAYSRRVVRGAYDVHYRQETSSGGVPVNTNAWLQAVEVQGGSSLDIDVPMVTVSAAITLNGQPPPDSAYDDGLLYLRNEQSGDSVLLGNTRLASLQRPVVPGTYELFYVVEAAGPTVPINAEAHLGTVDVASSPDLMVDIPVTTMVADLTVDGAAPPASVYDQADLFLQDVGTQDLIHLGRLGLGVLSRTLTAGTYVLVYRGLTSTGQVPVNVDAGLACIELTTP